MKNIMMLEEFISSLNEAYKMYDMEKDLADDLNISKDELDTNLKKAKPIPLSGNGQKDFKNLISYFEKMLKPYNIEINKKNIQIDHSAHSNEFIIPIVNGKDGLSLNGVLNYSDNLDDKNNFTIGVAVTNNSLTGNEVIKSYTKNEISSAVKYIKSMLEE